MHARLTSSFKGTTCLCFLGHRESPIFCHFNEMLFGNFWNLLEFLDWVCDCSFNFFVLWFISKILIVKHFGRTRDLREKKPYYSDVSCWLRFMMRLGHVDFFNWFFIWYWQSGLSWRREYSWPQQGSWARHGKAHYFSLGLYQTQG